MKITELPIEKTLVLNEDGLIAFVSVEQDESPLNPAEDGDWELISLNRRHSNFDKERFDDNRNDPNCVILSYYEHGNCRWFPIHQGPPGTDCQFDTTRLAGIWIPSESIVDFVKGEHGDDPKVVRRELVKIAAGCCESYSAWCNGEIYAFTVTVFHERKDNDQVYDRLTDYRYHTPLVSESCGNMYLLSDEDREEMLSNINQALSSAQ